MAKLADLKNLFSARQTEAKGPDPAPLRPKPAKASSRGQTAPSPALAPRGKHERDIDIKDAFVDVTPLAPGNRATLARERPAPRPLQRMADEAAALELSKYGSEPSPASWDIGQELEAGQTFVRAGVGTDVLSKLRRGQWVVQGELDLHHHTTEQAHDALADFLFEARSHGWRCVRVIHGKGLSSPRREPVLKGKVRRWLSVWDDVLAYCEAPPHGGGSGAVLVLLKSG